MALMRHAVPVAQADRLTESTESWDNVRTRSAVVAKAGKDVFEVARTLASYWPALGAGNQGRGRLTPAGDRRPM